MHARPTSVLTMTQAHNDTGSQCALPVPRNNRAKKGQPGCQAQLHMQKQLKTEKFMGNHKRKSSSQPKKTLNGHLFL